MFLEFPWKLEHTHEVASANWLVISVIGFLLVVLLVVKFIWPSMIRPHLVDRQQSIVDAAQQVETTLRETEEMRNDYRVRLDQIHDETQRRIAEAVQEADVLKDQILAEARVSADAIIRRGSEEVERERAKAMVGLRTQFVRGVIGAAQYAASRSLSDQHKRRLAEEFIAKVREKA